MYGLSVICKKLAAGLLLICVITTAMPLTVRAAEETASATLWVEQVFQNETNAADINSSFPYEFIPEHADTPMPSGSLSGSYSFTVDGSGTAKVGPITFTAPGCYSYTLRRSDSAISEKNYIYDKQVYALTIYVIRTGSGLTAQTIVKKGTGSKTDQLKFVNSYHPPVTTPSGAGGAKTGDATTDTPYLIILTISLFLASVFLCLLLFHRKRDEEQDGK